MKKFDPDWKEKFEHWLIHNLQLTSKSNVELIVKHVEHYYVDESTPSKEGEEEAVDGWISVKDRTPEMIADTDYSENVFAICEGRLRIMSYCWINMDENSGYVWADCNGWIDGEAEYDDDYNVTHWQPLPKPPFKQSKATS